MLRGMACQNTKAKELDRMRTMLKKKWTNGLGNTRGLFFGGNGLNKMQ